MNENELKKECLLGLVEMNILHIAEYNDLYLAHSLADETMGFIRALKLLDVIEITEWERLMKRIHASCRVCADMLDDNLPFN